MTLSDLTSWIGGRKLTADEWRTFLTGGTLGLLAFVLGYIAGHHDLLGWP